MPKLREVAPSTSKRRLKRKFDYDGYPCEPHYINKNVWYYVEKTGLTICHYDANQYPSEFIVIPWRMIRRALADHDKAKYRKPKLKSQEE